MELYTLTIIDWVEHQRLSSSIHGTEQQAKDEAIEDLAGFSSPRCNYSFDIFRKEVGTENPKADFDDWLDWLMDDHCVAVFIEKHTVALEAKTKTRVEPITIKGAL